ncbi:hypothetical protein GCM10007094_40310 [Pseudovibrio japonicus]|uniref:Lipoprotein n=1 Tax=Pseudovibrio japonicus TaxID=366534 RepID=A0ABQ3EPT3_9HYPH|nr:hypothetical protein [Pseudovibrio japonicus]GHB46878.1 hypothetical protein GCM10007094_40310 [Pseudovibrio japonicus]
MKLNLITTVLILVAITGCTSPKGELITPSANGYDKIVFQKTARFKIAPAVEYTIVAGSEFVQDRIMKGVPVYCGQVTHSRTIVASDCFIYEGGDTITVNPMRLYQGPRKLQQGTIKHLKAKR